MSATAWSTPSPASAYGLAPRAPVADASTELGSVASPSVAGAREGSLLHPDNPLVAFGLIAAVTFGLMAFSTSVRVGGTKAALSIGDTK